ncbi:Hypothetical protein BAMTRB_003 [Escherichia phage vB_Eco_Bam]|uniref:Uncharacterized protein n=1 Tax=Escherichia phage vB_Eco_Bam TaxID=2898833 RepID=A0A9P0VC01_9CAUD|nr:hypothetical protein TITUS_053 [Escherichia phage vB_Eco_Titus]CAI9888926.1 Hypothetical protein BAMTRB_003 [Escherichia phage vB_Eco_Bam]
MEYNDNNTKSINIKSITYCLYILSYCYINYLTPTIGNIKSKH